MRIGILGQISKEQIDDFFVIFEEELKKTIIKIYKKNKWSAGTALKVLFPNKK